VTTSVTATSAGGEVKTDDGQDDAFGGSSLLNELLVASGHRDEAAFARFYQLTSPWIYHLIRRRTGSTADAEDALRLVYTTIWRRADGFAPTNQSALAWATRIMYDLVGS
jgi:DNA-directed RNA polymerase specialized sigma24 family protein